jgi:hypothetical protein
MCYLSVWLAVCVCPWWQQATAVLLLLLLLLLVLLLLLGMAVSDCHSRH